MALVIYGVQLNVGVLQRWNASDTGHPFPGDFVYCVSNPGTGAYCYTSSSGGQNAFLFFSAPTVPAIGSMDTINTVTLNWTLWNPTQTPATHTLLVNNTTQTTFATNTTATVYSHTMALHPSIGTPGPWDLSNLSSSTWGLVTTQPYDFDNRCNLMTIQVDYTPYVPPPPPDAYVTVYVAGAYPTSCPQPPAKRFKPFAQFDTALGLEQQITAEWMRRYGKPPAGYQIWSYYRAASYDSVPAYESPASAFTIDPWPPPN